MKNSILQVTKTIQELQFERKAAEKKMMLGGYVSVCLVVVVVGGGYGYQTVRGKLGFGKRLSLWSFWCSQIRASLPSGAPCNTLR